MESEDRRPIACPRCGYKPVPSDRWVCSYDQGGCGTIWNTFKTSAICPGCGKQWCETWCLRCFRPSPHRSWYGPRFRRAQDDDP